MCHSPPVGTHPWFFPVTALQSKVCHTHQSLCWQSQGCSSPPLFSCRADAMCGCWKRHTNQTLHCCLNHKERQKKIIKEKDEDFFDTSTVTSIYSLPLTAGESHSFCRMLWNVMLFVWGHIIMKQPSSPQNSLPDLAEVLLQYRICHTYNNNT